MTWVKLESPTAKAASQITVTLAEGGSRGQASLNISFPSSLSGTLGFDAAGVERCDVHLGSGILAGKVWVQRAKTQLDEWVKKLGQTLAEKDIPVRIVTHGRTGFTMRRAVT